MGLDDIKKYMIGIVLGMVVIVSGLFIFGEFNSLNVGMDSDNQFGKFDAAVDKSNEVTASVNKIDASIQSVSSEGAGFLGLGWIDALVGSAFNGLKAIGNSLSFVTLMATGIGESLGVPSNITILLLLVITIIIAFAIWSAITRAP